MGGATTAAGNATTAAPGATTAAGNATTAAPGANTTAAGGRRLATTYHCKSSYSVSFDALDYTKISADPAASKALKDGVCAPFLVTWGTGSSCDCVLSAGSVKAAVTMGRPATTVKPEAKTPPTAKAITDEVAKVASTTLKNVFADGKTAADLKASAPKVTSTAAPAQDNGALRAAGVTAALVAMVVV